MTMPRDTIRLIHTASSPGVTLTGHRMAYDISSDTACCSRGRTEEKAFWDWFKSGLPNDGV